MIRVSKSENKFQARNVKWIYANISFLPTDRRKLITRKLAKEQINCSQCNSYECFVDEADMDDGYENKDELDEEISEWIAELAACKESGVQKNDAELYLGAMCSPYGDSVELAVFLNEECTIYSSIISLVTSTLPQMTMRMVVT